MVPDFGAPVRPSRRRRSPWASSRALRGGLHDAYPGSSGLGAIDVLVSEQDLALAQDVIAGVDTVGLEPDDADEEH